MTVLAFGILLFAGVHLIKSLAPGFRGGMQKRLGENGYKGLVSLLLLGSIALMVFGWRASVPQYVYSPIAALQMPAMLLLVLAFFLLVVSSRPSRLKRLLRHPQLTGVGLWGVAHLLLNGDSRSLLLFGGMTLWTLLEIVSINRRDGAWIKGDTPPLSADLVNVVITVIVVAVVISIHPWLAGVSVTGLLRQ